MKPEDLSALREISREIDKKDSKFRCVVSVMMLREGWDVRNVTTIVPLIHFYLTKLKKVGRLTSVSTPTPIAGWLLLFDRSAELLVYRSLVGTN